jgi:hypothetical protein
MNIKQFKEIERLREQFLLTLDDYVENEWWGTDREICREFMKDFTSFLEDKLDLESDEMGEGPDDSQEEDYSKRTNGSRD